MFLGPKSLYGLPLYPEDRMLNSLRLPAPREAAKLILSISLFIGTSTVQAQTYGFDNIGTDPAAIGLQKCLVSALDEGGGYYRMATLWTPPASGMANVQYSYNMSTFRAVVGNLPNGSPHPSEHMNWAVYVYDSFDAFRNDANQNWRALYTFNAGVGSMSYVNAPNCRYYVGTAAYDTPCWYLNLNLAAPSSVAYRTASGQSTTTPLSLLGGTRYVFSLVGFNSNAASWGIPCVVRTNATLPAQYSPPPNPPIFLGQSGAACTEAGLTSPCTVQVAHNDFYKITPVSFACNPVRSFVNWLNSPYPPLLNGSPDGNLPLTCGGAGQSPCCERAWGGKVAYSLTSTRRSTKILPIAELTAARAIAACPSPDC